MNILKYYCRPGSLEKMIQLNDEQNWTKYFNFL